MNFPTQKGAMSVEEFLHWASIGRTKFYECVNDTDSPLKIRKIGRKSVVTFVDAEAWLESLPEAA